MTFEASNLDRTKIPDGFVFYVAVLPSSSRRVCLPGHVKVAIEGSVRYQHDELFATASVVSGDARSAAIELRLESKRGSQGFYTGQTGSLVGTIRTQEGRVDRFELGPELLASKLDVRTATVTDLLY